MQRFNEIRAYYKKVLPEMMVEYQKTGNMFFDPYELDFTKEATPIEDYTWHAIRRYGVPFYPQIPALNYFLDFANPFKKIGIECDGKQWHNAEKDAIRDRRLIADGWTIYRIPGWQCTKIIDEPWEKFRKMEESGDDITQEFFETYSRNWFNTTCDGLVMALGIIDFGKGMDKYRFAAEESLILHISEPEEL